jgi:hypothetical protein
VILLRGDKIMKKRKRQMPDRQEEPKTSTFKIEASVTNCSPVCGYAVS